MFLGGSSPRVTTSLVVAGSQAYQSLVTYSTFDASGIVGFIDDDNTVSEFTSSYFQYYDGSVRFNKCPSEGYPVFNGVVQSGKTSLVVPRWNANSMYDVTTARRASYFMNTNLVDEYHMVQEPTVYNVPIVVNWDVLNSTLTGWNDAYGNGYTEGITITLGNSITELETATVYGLQGVVDGANVNTQAIINAIAAAQAAAAAAGATAGDIPLHEMTLPQQIATRFPFCIPFDLYNAFADISLGRSAPHWVIPWTVHGITATIDIDFSIFETWALIVRWELLVAFNIGLILITRKLIRG